jgi:hypothetical protein
MTSQKELVLSASMYGIINKMQHPISKIVLDTHHNKGLSENTFIDIHHENIGDVTMLSAKKAERIPIHEVWASKSRVVTGAGKLIRNILVKNGYRDIKGILTKDGHEEIKGRDIELFVTEFKSLHQTETKPQDNFRIVSGCEIKKWYLEDNYEAVKGTLGDSCMRYKRCQDYFRIYCNEPRVKMLILLDDYGKLLGRALVWNAFVKVEDGADYEITLMDRIFTTEGHYVDLFKRYAEKQNWWYKVYQTYDKKRTVSNGIVEKDLKMYVTFDNNYYNIKTPYVDTFTYMKEYTGTCWNYAIISDYKELTGTKGNLGEEEEEEEECCWECDGTNRVNCRSCDDGETSCCECDGDGCDDCDGNGMVECMDCDGRSWFECYSC